MEQKTKEFNRKMAEIIGREDELDTFDTLAGGIVWAPHSNLSQALSVADMICEEKECQFSFTIDRENSEESHTFGAFFFYDMTPSLESGYSDKSLIDAIYKALIAAIEKGATE